VVAALGHEWACETIRVPSEVDEALMAEAAVPSYECDLVLAALPKVAAAATAACIVVAVLLD